MPNEKDMIVSDTAPSAPAQPPAVAGVMDNAISVTDLKRQIHLIQQVMKDVLKEDEHYGTVPGCGKQKVLFKAGAEKLAFVFRMRHEYHVDTVDLPGGHREYRVTCDVYQIGSSARLGQGVGSACTMEGKWRFRTGVKELTGRPVPQDYWTYRKTDPAKAQALLGGAGFGTAKNPDTGRYEIAMMGDKMEHDNPADYYNTALKIGKKRAAVDATITCTACSDIFTQDLEEDDIIPPDEGGDSGEQKPQKTSPAAAPTVDKKCVALRVEITELATSKKINTANLNKSIDARWPGKNLDNIGYDDLLSVKQFLETYQPKPKPAPAAPAAQPEPPKE